MQRWPRRALPQNLSPVGTRCIQITIPDDDDWERAMYAEVSTLAQWMRWDRDLGKNGKPVSDIWLRALKTWKHCDNSPSPVPGGLIEDFEMPLRVDCDCNVFVTCCDGTEKQILTADQVNAIANGQPGNGAPQPAAGGGCQTYHGMVSASGKYYVPTIVNSGDTVEILNMSGAGTDGIGVRWFCPDGPQFFAGTCVGAPSFDGADPLPGDPHMSLIVNIDGTFHVAQGSPFTVPGGVVNGQLFIQVNDGNLLDNSGNYTFDVIVCNNQPAAWTHTFDFTTNPGPFNPLSDSLVTNAAVWVPGDGWKWTDQTLPGGSHERIVGIQLDPIAFNMDSIDFQFKRVMGTIDSTATSGQNLVLNTSVVNSIIWSALTSGDPLHYIWNTPTVITSRIAVQMGCANNNTGPTFDGSVFIPRCTINGHGTNPFA